MKITSLSLSCFVLFAPQLMVAQDSSATPAAEIEYAAFVPVAGQPMIGLRLPSESGVRWAVPGETVAGYKVEFIDSTGKMVVVSKDGKMQQLGLPASKVDGRPDIFTPLPHDLALADARGVVEVFRRTIIAMPGYRPYDPAIEKAYGPDFIKEIADIRANAPDRFIYALIRSGMGPATVSFPSIATDENLKRRYANLSANELRQLDLELTPLLAVRFQLNFSAQEAARAKAPSPSSK